MDRKTGAVFRSRDVIFEESITHLVKQSISTGFSEDNDPFQLNPMQNIEIEGSESHRSEMQTVTVVLWTSSHILYGLLLYQKGDVSKATY